MHVQNWWVIEVANPKNKLLRHTKHNIKKDSVQLIMKDDLYCSSPNVYMVMAFTKPILKVLENFQQFHPIEMYQVIFFS